MRTSYIKRKLIEISRVSNKLKTKHKQKSEADILQQLNDYLFKYQKYFENNNKNSNKHNNNKRAERECLRLYLVEIESDLLET